MEEESKDIQHTMADAELPEAWNDLPHPQDDIPREVIEKYMLRDYQRMLETYQRYRKQADMNIKHIENRARAIVGNRKTETRQLTELKLQLEDRNRKIDEMYSWLQQKDNTISSLCRHCAKQRDQIAVLERNLAAQRQQIQSLLSHIGDGGDGKDVLAACDASWSVERWKNAMVNIAAVRQQLMELMDDVWKQDLDESVRESLTGFLKVVRRQAVRAHNYTAKIASPVLRREFGADLIADDIDGNDTTDS